MRKRIEIELLSDLCVGSGYSYAGIVDNDVCYDEYGIPYIPARRIKGCMREALESLLYAKYPDSKYLNLSERLFGRTGESDYEEKCTCANQKVRVGKVRVGNACIKNYDEITEGLRNVYKAGEKYGNYAISTQDVLEKYTHILGQTKMKDGVTVDKSLRYTRVINKSLPGMDGNAKFYAEIEFNKADEAVIEDILKSVRHIGLKRNRGFGNVRCKLTDCAGFELTAEPEVVNASDGNVDIWFSVINEEPLVLSSQDETASDDYITGKSVLGAVASRYLRRSETNADSDEFRDLFLNGKTIFSNLYPYDGKRVYYPAPAYLNKLKKTRKYIYSLNRTLPDESELEENYKYGNGNQPKLLKGKFISIAHNKDEDYVFESEVEKDILFHNRHQNDEKGVERLLYSAEVIKPGQQFAGFIRVPDKYKALMISLLKEKEFYFGKSKSAQYGRCSVAILEDKSSLDEVKVEKICDGDAVLITFLSDGAFLNERGEYTTSISEIKKIICRELGIGEIEDDGEYISNIQTTLISGYHGKWNLRKSPIPAIRAGSFIVIKSNEEKEIKTKFVGERNIDGCGMIRVNRADEFTYTKPSEGNVEEQDNSNSLSLTDECQKLIIPILAEKWLENMAAENTKTGKIGGDESNSAVGRMKLMLMESLAVGKTYEDQKTEFSKRIESIKREQTKSEGKKLVEKAKEFGEIKEPSEFKEFLDLLGIKKEVMTQEVMKHWGDYIMALITHRKYSKKEGEAK
ncbi:MAG: hypothetical protein II038_09800 [Lachnospiraceae bacterium]|nr:hypothetical protein [Lachnospiraceae bacterium]